MTMRSVRSKRAPIDISLLLLRLLIDCDRGMRANVAVTHIIAHRLGIAFRRRAETRAAAPFEPDHIAGLQRTRFDRAQLLPVRLMGIEDHARWFRAAAAAQARRCE